MTDSTLDLHQLTDSQKELFSKIFYKAFDELVKNTVIRINEENKTILKNALETLLNQAIINPENKETILNAFESKPEDKDFVKSIQEFESVINKIIPKQEVGTQAQFVEPNKPKNWHHGGGDDDSDDDDSGIKISDVSVSQPVPANVLAYCPKIRDERYTKVKNFFGKMCGHIAGLEDLLNNFAIKVREFCINSHNREKTTSDFFKYIGEGVNFLKDQMYTTFNNLTMNMNQVVESLKDTLNGVACIAVYLYTLTIVTPGCLAIMGAWASFAAFVAAGASFAELVATGTMNNPMNKYPVFLAYVGSTSICFGLITSAEYLVKKFNCSSALNDKICKTLYYIYYTLLIILVTLDQIIYYLFETINCEALTESSLISIDEIKKLQNFDSNDSKLNKTITCKNIELTDMFNKLGEVLTGNLASLLSVVVTTPFGIINIIKFVGEKIKYGIKIIVGFKLDTSDRDEYTSVSLGHATSTGSIPLTPQAGGGRKTHKKRHIKRKTKRRKIRRSKKNKLHKRFII